MTTSTDPSQLPPGLPAPVDDGAAAHLQGSLVPDVQLRSTNGPLVSLARLGKGRVVVYAYPRTGRPGEPELTDDWDLIPGARGCTPQACGFRDHYAELTAAGANVFGLSTQSTADQEELVARLHLPFPVLSDANLALAQAMRLPTFRAAGQTLLRRLTLVIRDGRVEHVWYPVFPPDRHAAEVLQWLLTAKA
ncbi:MAG: peroxiredoxin [Chloroflexota bacterium]|nr:MAG: peroxiredoxin [Chloroflexota bacterium]